MARCELNSGSRTLIGSTRSWKTALTLLLAALSMNASADTQVFSGQGFGANQDLAKKQALAALSETLRVEVVSTFQARTDASGQTDAEQNIQTQSRLPLLGTSSQCQTSASGYHCSAILKTDISLPLYQAEYAVLEREIQQDWPAAQDPGKAGHYQLLHSLLSKARQRDKYASVIRLLSAKDPGTPGVSALTIRSALLKLKQSVPSLKVAAELLTKDLPGHTYFVQAPFPTGAKAGTQLSRLLRDHLSTQIQSTSNPASTEHFLRGHYEILPDGLLVSLRAEDRSGNVLATRLLRLPPELYKDIPHQASQVDFEKLLHEGYLVSNQFHAELNTNRGNDSLLFTANETIELFARLNQPGYFYIVAHNVADQLSYLVELNDAVGPRKFIHFVNADQANRWISLGEFEVAAPFGTENLQLIASNIDLVHRIPATRYNPNTELFEMEGKSGQSAVSATRALKPKRKKNIRSAEATLTYTTLQ